MKYSITIDPQGIVTTEVIDRGNVECSRIKQVTDVLGKELNDERTGPECDDVHERQV